VSSDLHALMYTVAAATSQTNTDWRIDCFMECVSGTIARKGSENIQDKV
jgi:hypothetical protein